MLIDCKYVLSNKYSHSLDHKYLQRLKNNLLSIKGWERCVLNHNKCAHRNIADFDMFTQCSRP